MTLEDDPLAELRKLMGEAVYGHRFDKIVYEMCALFDTLAHRMHLSPAERMVILLAKARAIACEENDTHLLEAFERMLKPILPDMKDKP